MFTIHLAEKGTILISFPCRDRGAKKYANKIYRCMMQKRETLTRETERFPMLGESAGSSGGSGGQSECRWEGGRRPVRPPN